MLLITRACLVAYWARQAATAYDATVCDQRSYTSPENMTCTEYCPNNSSHVRWLTWPKSTPTHGTLTDTAFSASQ